MYHCIHVRERPPLHTMQHLSTAFLIIALVIVVNYGGATVQSKNETDQQAEEVKTKYVAIAKGPKYVNPPHEHRPLNGNYTNKLEPRPPSKPPIKPKLEHTIKLEMVQPKKVELSQQFYNKLPRLPPLSPYPLPSSAFRFPRVIPLPPGRHYYASPSRTSFVYATTGKPFMAKSPKFSLPLQTINGILSDFGRPLKIYNITTTTVAPTTTTRALRTKRIWPKRLLDKMNSNSTATNATTITNKTETNTNTNSTDYEASASASKHFRTKYANLANNDSTSTTVQPTTRGYRRVTRAPRKKTTTLSPNFDNETNDWVPIIPTHYPIFKYKPIDPSQKTQPISKRSDFIFPNLKSLVASPGKQPLFVQPYRLLPVIGTAQNQIPTTERKKMIFFKRKPILNPYLYSAYSQRRLHTPAQFLVTDLHTDSSHFQPKFVTKIKHHHHHHHHRYIKTIDRPVKVPIRVEVPQPYPVEKKVPVPVPVQTVKVVDRPYPVKVEKRVPYPVPIKVPHPIPVKVVEKEYVPKPYPIIHHIPVVKHVQVLKPYPVEKKVPYPVKVPVPVDRPVPVTVEKKVPYPVHVKVFVPQPYPVERRVPYPVEVKVKEPVEVIKHVAVGVPYLQPYPVKVPHPVRVTVEKKVPYPVEVEKRIPVPVEVLVPQKVEVEKRVPVYVPRPYPVEKKVPYPVNVPYPVKVPVQVPVKVPVEVPVYIHHPVIYSEEKFVSNNEQSDPSRSDEVATDAPQHTVTVHGNTGFTGFQSRSDVPETTSSTETP